MTTRTLFVVTGATGFVGSQLVPGLEDNGDLLLVSRDPAKAALKYPNAQICNYEDLSGCDLVGATFIHLAVRNNDEKGTLQVFQNANVEHLLDVAAIAKERGAERFVNLCSTHAIEPGSDDFYGQSKQEGAMRLSAFWPEGAINLYVPAIYGTNFSGRLRILNRFPNFARPWILSLLQLVKPSLSIERLRAALKDIPDLPDRRENDPYWSERYLSDPIAEFGLAATIKRAIDLLAALALIVFAGWLIILIAAYVRYDSSGPAIFAQKRVGKDARVFTCFKFRTMAIGTVDAASHEVLATCVTNAGRFLRRTKLDELPQVINVLRNEMSLVGPRPCLPIQHDLIEHRVARGVLTLKPGITGLAQVKGVDMSDPALLAALDDRYRAFRTLVGDCGILLRTALGGGSGDRVRVKKHE